MALAPDSFGKAYTGSITDAILLQGPGVTPLTVAASASVLSFKPRFIHVGGAAGAITYTANGITITETLEVGYHPIRPDVISSIAGGTTVTAWQ